MREEILTLARAASGAGEAEEALLEPLCRAAYLRWEARLRPGLTPEACGAAFACAAAFTAAAGQGARRGGRAVAPVKAGGGCLRGRGAAETASLSRDLRRTAEGLMAPYAAEADFCFRGVRGLQTGCGRFWSGTAKGRFLRWRRENGTSGPFCSRCGSGGRRLPGQ